MGHGVVAGKRIRSFACHPSEQRPLAGDPDSANDAHLSSAKMGHPDLWGFQTATTGILDFVQNDDRIRWRATRTGSGLQRSSAEVSDENERRPEVGVMVI